MALILPRLYAIIDPSRMGGRAPKDVCEELLEAGVRLIQYRDKQGSSLAVFEVCAGLSESIRKHHGFFIVNDRADIALAAGAEGVHVGQEDLPVELARKVVGPHRWVGVSTHNLSQVREADTSSADYIAFGPIFETQSKERPDKVVGIEGLREAREATTKPLVAIGGITAENALSVIEAGADVVAVIQALLAGPKVEASAREFMRILGG
jgi:thiamine-phosphate pyrophosphorylase